MDRRLWCVVALVGVAVPAPARAATEQVIAADDTGADVAVDPDGSAFLVSPSTRRSPGTLSMVRARRAAPGAMFGPSRILMRSSRTDRAVHAGVAADGSGVIVVQSLRRPYRRVRVVTFTARGPVGAPVTVSRGRRRADVAASAVARGGAAVVVWFRHRGGRRWRLEAAIREPGAVAFGTPRALSSFVRRACCTSVSVGIGERGDVVATWSSTSRPGVWVAQRAPRRGFRSRRLAAASSGVPSIVVGAGGSAALTYAVQHVPRRAGDGLQLHRAVRGGPFGVAEPVDPAGRASTGAAAVTPAGRVLVAWVDRGDEDRGARLRVSEAGPGEPLVATGELGTSVSRERLAVAAADDGRAVVAWPRLASAGPARLEQAVAATRQARGAPFGAAVALGQPWTTVEPGLARLVPRGGALVVWRASGSGSRAERRTALAVTRLP
jgi:hypothetical protein